jgi:hypothetical protein
MRVIARAFIAVYLLFVPLFAVSLGAVLLADPLGLSDDKFLLSLVAAGYSLGALVWGAPFAFYAAKYLETRR